MLGKILKVFGVLFLFFFMIGLIFSPDSDDPPPTSSPQAVAQAATSTAATDVAQPAKTKFVPKSNWDYQIQQDQMTSGAVTMAVITSENSLDLDFPYRGENNGRLVVRRHPKSGLNVFVKVDKGQMLCNSYDGCTIEIRFDDSPPVNWSAIGPSDLSSDMVFLNNESRFVERAKKAKRILVSIEFFQNGKQVLEFKTPVPLEWGGKKKT